MNRSQDAAKPPVPSGGTENPTAKPSDPAERQLHDLREILLHPSAIAEPVRKGLFVAIRKNKDEVAEVIFPVIGPAIRRAISQALAQMVENSNRLLEDSLSLRNVRWRIEAARTGRSLAEVALLRSLNYEVEQVFLIHRDSGLLIQHVAQERTLAQPPEVVSGMLTGIRDFVQDSFGGTQDDGVRRLEVGDRTVWVEQHGSAVLAAVVSGHGPAELGWRLRDTLERIAVDHGPAIADFDGDASSFDELQPLLRTCLQSEQKPPAKTKPWTLVIVLGVLAAVIALLAWRWQSARDAGDVAGPSKPQVLETLPVARRILEPPDSVNLALGSDGELVVTGTAATRWTLGLRRAARSIEGVRCVDLSRLQTTERIDLDAAARAVEQIEVSFLPGEATLSDEAAISTLVDALGTLDRAGWKDHARIHARIEGHADASGSESLNRRLSLERAQAVQQRLQGLLLWSIRFSTHGQGTPGAEDATRDSRAVSVRIELERAVWYQSEGGCR